MLHIYDISRLRVNFMSSVYLGTVASNILKNKAIMCAQENKISERGGPALAHWVE